MHFTQYVYVSTSGSKFYCLSTVQITHTTIIFIVFLPVVSTFDKNGSYNVRNQFVFPPEFMIEASVDHDNADPTDHNTKTSSKEHFFRLAPFNPSSQQIQDKALEYLKLDHNDVLFDLGCGDGRLLCHAVQQVPGLRCVGIEIDPIFVERAQRRRDELSSPEFQSRIQIRCQDALQVAKHNQSATDDSVATPLNNNNRRNISMSHLTLMDDATALYLFVLPKGIQKMFPILEAVVQRRLQQRRNFQILSYMFQIHGWEPTVVDRTSKGGCPIYYYEW
jgi:precorrin-6B methylase 2